MLNSPPEMPRINSCSYALWDEPNSEEPVGWSLAKVTSIEDGGTICLKYHKGNLTEVTKLTELKWHPACGINRWFQPLNVITNTSPMSLSKPHKVEGFADELTIISASSSDHTEALKAISSSCNDLDLTLKPSKCISFVYDGKKMNK